MTSIIDALRRLGTSTQKTAIGRQDEQLANRKVLERRRHVARSVLGSSPMFVATIEPVPETVVPLTAEELAPILENAALAGNFIAAFGADDGNKILVDQLDSAFGAWMKADDKKGYTDEAVIEIVGAAFGKLCADDLDMRWIRVTDDIGTSLAVQGKRKDFRGFPYAAIAKRIPVGEYGFFRGIYISLQEGAQGDWNATD